MATVCVVLQSGLKSWLDMVTTTVSLYKRVPRQKKCTPWKKRISRVLIFAHPACAKINVTRNLGKVKVDLQLLKYFRAQKVFKKKPL